MAKTFQVSSADLRRAAENLRNINSNFNSQLSQLEAQERQLHGQWEGQAHGDFDRAFQSDKAKFTMFYNGINDYIRALEQAAQQYEIAEDQSRSIAQFRKH